MKKKKILITGINGQDGAYLANYLLKKKNVKIYGLLRRTANYKLNRLECFGIEKKIEFIYSDICEYSNINKILNKIKPDILFNLAAQSYVDYSFTNPKTTFQINTEAVFNILETIKNLKLDTKFYQASTSEMYGNTNKSRQNETTPFSPVSPYGISKAQSYELVKTYRNVFNIFASNGILFNHESPYRGSEFVTKKIVSTLSKIKQGSKEILNLGNIDSARDWGYAGDYMDAINKIMKIEKPDDFVVATGKTVTVRNFFLKVCKELKLNVIRENKNNKELYINKENNRLVMVVNKKLFRQNELNYLCGDYSKIKKQLGWKPKLDVNDLIKLMVDFEISKKQSIYNNMNNF